VATWGGLDLGILVDYCRLLFIFTEEQWPSYALINPIQEEKD